MQKNKAIPDFYSKVDGYRKNGWTKEEVKAELSSQNQTLEEPLPMEDIDTIIEAAYFLDIDYNDIITMTYRDDVAMMFRKDIYEFLFTEINISKSGKLKTILNLSKDGKYLLKTEICPAIHSHREKFVKASDDKELDRIIVEIDNLIRKQLEKEEKALLLKAKQTYIMTGQEKTEAMKFLTETKDILYRIVDATNRMGVVGEEALRLNVYLCFTSRILKDPVSTTVKGESSSGKSFSCQSVLRLIPEEGYHFITRATQNAFYHLPEDGMQHKIIYINEIQGSETADYSIRSAQSEGDLILMMPIKDPVTGNMETITKRVKGPVGFLVTTTKPNMFDENETRNFSVFSDDTPELTERIGKISIRKAKGEIFELDSKEINLWKNIQRLLKPDLKVIIPYAEEVLSSFPSYPVRVRRDRERFRIFLNVITILHQTHRQIENGLIYSTVADYQIAKILGEDILMKTIFESSPLAETLVETILQMEDNFKPSEGQVEFNFTYQEIADYMQWEKQKVKKWMVALSKNGFIEYIGGGGKGQGHKAVMRVNRAKFKGYNKFLPEIGHLLAKYPCDESLFYNPLTGEKGIFRSEAENRPF